jgi:hypothetical protein
MMHALRSLNTMMKKYMAMPRAHHFEGRLTGGQHIYERIYNYARQVTSWCTPCNHATQWWKNTWLCHRLIILKGALQAGNTFTKEYITMRGKCHNDACLAITQHNDEKIHGYVTDSSFWRVPYRRATHSWKNIYLCKRSVILMHPLQLNVNIRHPTWNWYDRYHYDKQAVHAL